MWELLICPTCKHLFENPKILPCAHSLCEKCLISLKEVSSDTITCPSCRVACTVTNVSSNFFLSSVLDILKRETNACSDSAPCDACSVHGLRNLRCEDCDLLLCTKCLHLHHDKVITREKEHVQTIMKNEIREDKHEHGQEITKNGRITNEHELTTSGHERPRHAKPNQKTVNGTQEDEPSTQHDMDKHAATGNNMHEYAKSRIAFARQHLVHMPLTCKRHPGEDLRFFCNSCAQLVCQDCVIAQHITHIFVSTSDAAPSSKAQLKTLLNETPLRVLYLSQALRDVKDTVEQLRSCVTNITNTIHGLHSEEGKSDCSQGKSVTLRYAPNSTQDEKREVPKLDKENQALLRDLNSVARRKFEILANHRHKLETRLRLLENCTKFTLNLILHGSDEEILMLENLIMESMGELCQKTPEVPIECPNDDFIALENQRCGDAGVMGSKNCPVSKGGDTLEGGVVSKVGYPKIITGKGSGSCCFATGNGLASAIVGQECSFTVTVKNEQNRPCVEGPSSLVARVKAPDGGYFTAELIENKNSKHKFRYRTYSAGLHVLRITLRGEEILGSPFEAHCSGSTDYSRRGRLVTKFGTLGSNDGELNEPQGIAVDRLSRIFVADTGNHRVQVFDEYGRFLFGFGKEGIKAREFNRPSDVTIARTGHVIVADQLNDRLQFFMPNGKFVRLMHSGMVRPTAITTNQYNNILVVDSNHTRVLVVTMSGDVLRHIVRGSSASGRLENVQGVACNQTGETFIISRIPALNTGGRLNAGVTTAAHASLIQVFDNNGSYIREFVTPSYSLRQTNCCRLVTDCDDRVLATGSGNKVQVFTRVGGHLTNISFTANECSQIDISAIALSPSETVVVVDTTNGRILVF